ncbi:Rne/Rng family ribonuclease [Aurantiacibacter suaedae]|uniref:Rne/Rng family ribonuclease n=1 Tax=Aurantiacibacter suaedae TaxID=2545755 RepID=UPI0010F93F06|nr:ribonuclease E/G [Aurantiacibacter suaedae]
MATRMLIDARHPEETRVAVLQGNRIEEFDFESAEHKQIKGNIYLAKVTRVEPSLQAAFVDFGGNRHGFLAFSEIHPDYYQIPQSDRDALLAEEQAAAEEEAALREQEDGDDVDLDEDDGDDEGEPGVEEIDTSEKKHVATIEDGHVENGDDDDSDGEDASGDGDGDDDQDESESGEDDNGEQRSRRGRGRGRARRQGNGRRSGGGSRAKEIDEARAKRQALRRRYKIQDVIQRRQVLLVQVVKEERGNKGAALTTYLSLAGRYCVLMPNSSHGGGISRKISSGSDRKRLKSIVSDLSLPRSMGLIVRTAGLSRTKTEIKRDFDYLARLWDEIRENTLKSSAPSMIHSDSDLIKRAIRDIYNREIEEVVVEGEAGYKAARNFMKLLMPSHARRVKHYSDPVPLFQRYGAEDQLSAMYDPMVQLKSGGYLIINPTEALVSIDINSGRSTKEHGIEQTALHTNLEAAREIARQLRLRDMAGLVVIDFIDMEHGSNVRKVEKAMKDALKNDRARIQVGRISGFGLMEMSRQRLRTGVLEATTRECPHCDGTGLVRTASSAGLSALRLIEDEAAKGKGTLITLYASTEASIYLLNSKRADLAEIEKLYGVTVEVQPEGEDEGAKMRVTSSGPRPTETPKFEQIVDEDDDDDTVDDEDEGNEDESDDGDDADQRRSKRRRRRRGGRGRNKNRTEDGDNDGSDDDGEEGSDDDASDNSQGDNTESDNDEDGEDKPRRRRRRGGRGRNRRRDENGAEGEDDASSDGDDSSAKDAEPQAADTKEAKEDTPAPEVAKTPEPEAEKAEGEAAAPAEEEAPKPKRRSRAKKAEPKPEAEAESEAPAEEAPKPKRRSRAKKADTEAAPAAEGEEAPKPKRRSRAKKVAEPAPEEAIEAKPEADATPAPAEPEAAEPAQDTAPVEEAPTPEAPAAEDSEANAESGEDQPKRGGWWQRTFGN